MGAAYESPYRPGHWIDWLAPVERDIGTDAILKAIEAAERDLMLGPLPADNALGHALENELLSGKPAQPKKAAA